MLFWIITAALTLGVAMLFIISLRRGSTDTPAEAFDLQVYRDQLSEVDRDLARGIVNAEDAERARTEISRRILAADAALKGAQARGNTGLSKNSLVPAAVILTILAGGSFGLYMQLGAPGYGDFALADRIAFADTLRAERISQEQAEAQISAEDFPPVEPPSPDYLALVEKLREVVSARPKDADGLSLLAASERNLGNYQAARSTFSRYLDLRGESATATDFAVMADIMILAAGGYVSPEAERALSLALKRDPKNGLARYYVGLMFSQTGRPDRAIQFWDSLLREGPADAPWIAPIETQIDTIAARAGMNYERPVPGPGAGNLRGPSSEDIASAEQMSAEDRAEMIAGMVEQLGERLANEGGTAEEWARLINALGVLNRRDDAQNVYQNALEVFAGDSTALSIISSAGQRAGVAQ